MTFNIKFLSLLLLLFLFYLFPLISLLDVYLHRQDIVRKMLSTQSYPCQLRSDNQKALQFINAFRFFFLFIAEVERQKERKKRAKN